MRLRIKFENARDYNTAFTFLCSHNVMFNGYKDLLEIKFFHRQAFDNALNLINSCNSQLNINKQYEIYCN